jgi:nucleotide-binding universal stress UspA family protein
MMTIQTILHPTDFSPRSEQALHLACSFARDHGARLIVLHVMERPVFVHSGIMDASVVRGHEDDRNAVQEQLRQIRSPDPTVPVTHRLEEGDVAAAILQVAQESRCDLIVMGTHGRTGLRRLLMGSVAEQVVRKARCPVLTVKVPFSTSACSGVPTREHQMAAS